MTDRLDIEVKPKAFLPASEIITRKDTRYTNGKITFKGKRYTIRGGIRTPYCIYLSEHKAGAS